MNISSVCAAPLALILAGSASCLSRPVDAPRLEELWAQADLVAAIRITATTNAPDQLTSAGPNYGPRNPADYQALNSRFSIVFVMKGAEGRLLQPTNELTLLHFRYAPDTPEFNGGCFIYFHAATNHFFLVNATNTGPAGIGAQGVVGGSEPVTYLAFLTRRQDGRYQPVSGHYDSEPSFRMLALPLGGQISYCEQDIVERNASGNEANQSVEATADPPRRQP